MSCVSSATDTMALPWPSSAGAQQMIEIAHVMAGGWDLERKASAGTLAMFCLQRPPLQHTTRSDCTSSAVMTLSVCMYTSHAHQDDHRHRHFVPEPNLLQPPSSHDDMRPPQITHLALCVIYTPRRHPPERRENNPAMQCV